VTPSHRFSAPQFWVPRGGYQRAGRLKEKRHLNEADVHMTPALNGMRVAFVGTNEGIEQVELTGPWKAVEEAGGEPALVAPEGGT
jgi:hypothetical protein